MQRNNYKGYFKSHYKSDLSEKDLLNYTNWFDSQWNIIKKKIKLNKKVTVLEIGSGFGGFYNIIQQQISPKNYVGIELDQEAITFSKKHFNNSNFIHTSLEKYNSPKKFDYIFAFEVLEHLEDPLNSIKKLSGLLKPDGIFIATTPYPYAKNITADKTHLYVLHPLNWKRLLTLSNLKVTTLEPMSFLPFIWRINKNLNFRIKYFLPFNGMISTILIVAKKKILK